jgi:3-oxoacyl-[acyl-carrier protein] reductase
MKDKVVFISGSARGLGASLAESYYHDNANVFCASRSGEKPKSLENTDPKRVSSGTLDICDYPSCEQAISQCLLIFGRIDILINNASGFFGRKKIGDYSPVELRSEIETTLLGAINLTNVFVERAALEDINQHIIFISSTSGLSREGGNELFPVYAAAKAGIIRFAECINASTRDKGIYSHTLIPSNIREANFAYEAAVSRSDVFQAIKFLIEPSHNLYVDQIVLNPARVEKT